MGVEEETVRTPREWLDPPIQKIVRWYLGQMATMFFLEVLLMFSVFGLNIPYPNNDSGSGRDANEKADPTPKCSRACSMVLDRLALSNPFGEGASTTTE